MPTPIATKITIIIIEDCVKAKVRAVPTKGAEHGVAIKVAKKPLRKSRV